MARPLAALGCFLALFVVAACGATHSAADARIIHRAENAIGSGPIVHVIWEIPTGSTYINLKTGVQTPSVMREELWTDRQAHRVHLVVSQSGRVIGDELLPQDGSTSTKALPSDPAAAFAAEWLGYPAVLKKDASEVVGRGVVRGRRVDWLRLESSQSAFGEHVSREVAVDARSYKPVLFRTSVSGSQGNSHFDQWILVANAIPYSSADFKREGPELRTQDNGSSQPGSGDWANGGTSATISNPPATSVHAPWLTAGETADGLKLGGVNRLSASKRIGGEKETVHGVEIVYGPMLHGLVAGSLSTTVDELPRPDQSTDWRSLPPHSIEIQVSEVSDSSESVAHPHPRTTHAKLWTGNLKKDGLYITIATYRGRAALLEIARSLHRGAT